jgi:hypothetical protein
LSTSFTIEVTVAKPYVYCIWPTKGMLWASDKADGRAACVRELTSAGLKWDGVTADKLVGVGLDGAVGLGQAFAALLGCVFSAWFPWAKDPIPAVLPHIQRGREVGRGQLFG